MAMIADNIGSLRDRMKQACLAAGRPVQSVTLLCVSKTASSAAVREAFDAGECAFGENHVQEGVRKIEALADLRSRLSWHMIGPIQANKTRPVAEHFDWVHAIDRFKVAQRLSEQRPASLAPLQVCVQVNVSGESSKAGVAPAAAGELARAVAGLPGIRLRGLMSIPEPCDDVAGQRAAHRMLRELMAALNREGMALDTLSMGMTADVEAAIMEGATLVRIGTAIFGARGLPQPGAEPN
jgi:PLP dependent protein